MTILSVCCYALLVAAILRLFRMPKRSDEMAARLISQYPSDGDD